VYYAGRIFEAIQENLSNQNNIEILFLGPEEKNFHWLSNQKILNGEQSDDFFFSYLVLVKDTMNLS